MQSILALDVSGKVTGWAFGFPTDKPISGFEPWKREGDTEDEVFRRGMIWLFRQMDFLKPSIVAIEAPIKTSGGGSPMLPRNRCSWASKALSGQL